jgi:hypothetical protein
LKPFVIFLCHKKSSGKDFADHLKAGLEELGYHSFLDSKDIPKMTDGVEEWVAIRDQALKESKYFILLITPGFELSPEVIKELRMAREFGNKRFLYFRHRDLGRKIVVDLGNEKLDLGRQEQVSFESKEELLRLAHGILLKEGHVIVVASKENSLTPQSSPTSSIEVVNRGPKNLSADTKTTLNCDMCSKPIEGQPYVELIGNVSHNFHCKECAQTFKKFKSLYGDDFK